jgi:transposase
MNKGNGGEAKDRLHCLSDETWSLIESGFPHAVGGKGFAQKYKSREVLEAVLYRARTGCPWRDLPKAYGPWHTIYMRWQRWVIDGVLNRAWGVLKEMQPDGGKLDFSMIFLDSTVVRAHQHAAGAQKKRPTSLGSFKGRVLLQNTRRLC